MTVSELSYEVRILVQQKKYSEALALFKSHKSQTDTAAIAANEYLVADMLTALRGTGAYEAGFRFLEIYQVPVSQQTPLRILNSYGWLVYYVLRNETKKTGYVPGRDLSTVYKALSLLDILKKASQLHDTGELKYSTSLIEFLFKLLIGISKNMENNMNRQIIALCENVDPEMLSTEVKSIQVERKGAEKEMELASAREEWYAAYSKALYETEKYDQCMEMCKEASEKIHNLHYNNEIWFMRRIALCHIALEQYTDAIPIYTSIVKQKKDWFILKELSECYYKTGDTERALQLGRQAATSFGPVNFKVELIEILGDMLQSKGENKLALKHYLLVKLIREAENWQPNQNLLKKINRLSEEKLSEKVTKDGLKIELTAFWNERHNNNKLQNNTRQKGTISKLLPEKPYGTDGFITSESKTTYYFFTPKQHPSHGLLKTGIKVEFEPEQTEKGLKAVKIKLLS